MHILLTTGFLATNTGSEMVIRDLAKALSVRGHEVAIYSPRARGLRELGGARIIERPNDLTQAPDIIHGQHATSILPAWQCFPDVPLIQSIQDVSHPLDEPLTLPSVRHYIAVDQVRAERIRSAGIPDERITLIPNTVALDRFRPKPTHNRITRALIVAKYHPQFVNLARRALEPQEVSLKAVGVAVGGMRDDFPELLASYDLLIGSGRCVLEAAAVGLSAIVCDERGFAGPLTLQTWPELRDGNFGMPAFAGLSTPQRIAHALAALDPMEAPLLREVVRREAALEHAVDSLEGLYHRVLEEAAKASGPADTGSLFDYVLRLQEHCMQTMVVKEMSEGRYAIAQMVERQKAAALKHKLDEAAVLTKNLERSVDQGRKRTEEIALALKKLRQKEVIQARQLAEAEEQLRNLQLSASWRMTKPLRQLMTLLRSTWSAL